MNMSVNTKLTVKVLRLHRNAKRKCWIQKISLSSPSASLCSVTSIPYADILPYIINQVIAICHIHILQWNEHMAEHTQKNKKNLTSMRQRACRFAYMKMVLNMLRALI